MISIKLHKSYRTVVAICDSDLIGKKFEEDIKQLDIRENFYGNSKLDEKGAIKLMQEQLKEDATFNIVGKESIRIAIKAGVIAENSVGSIQGIPFTLKLL